MFTHATDIPRSLGGSGFCSVSPARFAGSSLTCAEPTATQAPSPRIYCANCYKLDSKSKAHHE